MLNLAPTQVALMERKYLHLDFLAANAPLRDNYLGAGFKLVGEASRCLSGRFSRSNNPHTFCVLSLYLIFRTYSKINASILMAL